MQLHASRILSVAKLLRRYQAGLRDEYWGVERLEFVVGLVAGSFGGSVG